MPGASPLCTEDAGQERDRHRPTGSLGLGITEPDVTAARDTFASAFAGT